MINRDSPLPLYAQVKRRLKAEIMSWPPKDDRFYTDQELQGIFGVSRATVRQALTELEEEGLVRRQQGFGTFVNRNKIEESFSTRRDFSTQWAQSGRSLRVEHLKVARKACPPSFAKMLGIAPHSEVLSLERLRVSGDMRIAWDLRFMPISIAGDIPVKEFENVSLIDVLRPVVNIERADTQIEAALAGEEYSERLNIDPAAAILIREMVYFSSRDEPVFSGVSVYRADQVRYKFSAPLQMSGATVESDVRVNTSQSEKSDQLQ
ncbi:MAG: GntR family transcriptional regulator [Pseudomonadota bacterium]